MSQIGDASSPPAVQSRLLRGLDPAAMSAVIGAARRMRRKRGELIFRQGAPAEHVYILEQGQAKLTQLSADGEVVLIRVAVPGDALGGVGAFAERLYPVSAEAAEECVVLAWSGRVMDRLLRAYPQLAISFIDFLAGRLHEMQTRYEELARQQVEQRLARTLLRLVARAGRRVESGVLIDLRLSRQDLAEMTGTSLFTVSRILKRWQDQGVIASRRQRIVVLHPHGLVSIAEDLPQRGRA